MCTLSFVPTQRGYLAAMNRDERLTRPLGMSPELFRMGDTWAAYPHEQDGGTWFATNEHGITLGLLNWNLAGELDPAEKQRSRGCLIPRLIGYRDLAEISWEVSSIKLEGILPFRLVGISYHGQAIGEWRWDGSSLHPVSMLPWQPRHWFSSGLSDELAERERGEACRIARRARDAGSLPWLRALHRSHSTLPGPFSICVHRPDAGTVSYSEAVYSPTELQMSYVDGQPCRNGPVLTLDIPLAAPQDVVSV